MKFYEIDKMMIMLNTIYMFN